MSLETLTNAIDTLMTMLTENPGVTVSTSLDVAKAMPHDEWVCGAY